MDNEEDKPIEPPAVSYSDELKKLVLGKKPAKRARVGKFKEDVSKEIAELLQNKGAKNLKVIAQHSKAVRSLQLLVDMGDNGVAHAKKLFGLEAEEARGLIETFKNMPHAELQLALVLNGFNSDLLAKQLLKALDHKSLKLDKNGDVHEYWDTATFFKAAEVLINLFGWMPSKKSERTNVHLFGALKNMSDKVLNENFKKIMDEEETVTEGDIVEDGVSESDPEGTDSKKG